MKATYLYLLMGLTILAGCSAEGEILSGVDEKDIIHVGGVNTDDMATAAPVTRAAVAAEGIDWLSEALKKGIDMTYLTKTNQQKALLRLETDDHGDIRTSEGNITIYSLTAYHQNGTLTTTPAKWLDNGAHTFQGVYVPEVLKSESTAQNYEAQTRYTAVPPSHDINATVGRITIPLQHRLARVVAYVLIDPSMNTTLKGYQKDDNHNGEHTQLRFCNVQTLKSVDANNHPVWQSERKAIPNYLGEEPEIIVYKEKTSGRFVFPIDDDYKTVSENPSNYETINYRSCPYYDIIVRPTYTPRTTGTNVMYDEAEPTTALAATNKIDFELTLANDLEYEKSFSFDLNANDETVVYLRVSPERIDYNSAGSRLWKETSYSDNDYGVNNQNGNNLSMAGSSWQRAYTNSTFVKDVTDGHYYQADDEDTEAQYVGNDKWIEMLLQAYEGGKHHGDYFILKNDIKINTDSITFPANYLFTGHLDALDYTITLTGSRAYLFDGLNGTYTTKQETDQNATWEANVHKEGNTWVPTMGWRAEVVNLTVAGGKLLKDRTHITGYLHNCQDANGAVTDHTPTIPIYPTE